jgi:hypothetical protein
LQLRDKHRVKTVVTPREKGLYHQIHPAKLLTDWCAGGIALYLLWRHELATALVVMLIPPPVASWLVIRSANLEPYRESPLGRYVARYMTHAMEAVRLVGMVVMAVGAWDRSPPGVVLGAAVVLFGWLRGVLTSKMTGQP